MNEEQIEKVNEWIEDNPDLIRLLLMEWDTCYKAMLLTPEEANMVAGPTLWPTLMAMKEILDTMWDIAATAK